MNRSRFVARLREWWATASAIILLAIAALGVLYDAVHRFGPHELADKMASPEQVIVLLVALLCGGLGAERLLTLKKIETDIEAAQDQRGLIIAHVRDIAHDLEKLSARIGKLRTEIVADFKHAGELEEDIITEVRRINKVETLVGPRDIEEAARRLLDECSDSEKIKATGQYRVGDGLSREYFEHIADRVARAQKNRGSMEYHVIVAGPETGVTPDVEERLNVFREANIEERLQMRGAKHPWPFEVLIGGHSMIIALLGGDKKSRYEVAVKITDPEFVEKAAEWYREVAWERAERL